MRSTNLQSDGEAITDPDRTTNGMAAGTARPPAAVCLRPHVLYGWFAAIAVYAVLIHGGIAQGSAAVWVTDVAWTLAALLATVAAWRASRRLWGHRRTAWRLFAAGCAAWLAGQLVWDWYELARGMLVPVPNAGDYGYIGFGLLFIAGLFVLRATQPVRQVTPERVANIGLIVCSLTVVLVAMVLEPMTHTRHSGYFLTIMIAESLSITAAFVMAVHILWSYRWGESLRPLVLLVLGLAVHTFCALVYTSHVILGHFDAGHPINIGWLIAFALIYCAAAEQSESSRRGLDDAQSAYTAEGWIEALVPALLLFIIACSAVAFIELISARVVLLNATLLGVFAALLAFRETWLYSQGLDLRATLRRASSELSSTRERLRRSASERQELEQDVSFVERAGGIGLWDWDLRKNHVQYSRQWKRQLGYADQELSDDPNEWYSRLHPDDSARVQAELRHSMEDPSREYRVEMRLRHRDGSYRWILAQGTVLLDEAGHAARMRGVHVDITPSKQLEEALRESEARYREIAGDLERRVAERTADLRDAYRESQSFAYAVAHDLKAPLRAIDGFSHLLQESAAGHLSQAERDYVQRVRRGAIQMEALIEALLAYSRIEHREFRLGQVELRSFVAEIAARVREICPDEHVEVKVDVPTVWVRADREGLGVVLHSLIDNALKFTRHRPRPCIEIGARIEHDVAVLWIKDNGIGFDAVYRDKIFEIFQRLHRPDEYEGTGIGLALARKAMQRMRGRIWADAVPGEGATFFLALPKIGMEKGEREPDVEGASEPAPAARSSCAGS